MRYFHLSVTLADQTGKVIAWCTGQTAAELLQISPDEFFVLPEVNIGLQLCMLVFLYSLEARLGLMLSIESSPSLW